MAKKPAFDPNKSFEGVDDSKPEFDPNAEFEPFEEPTKKKSGSQPLQQGLKPAGFGSETVLPFSQTGSPKTSTSKSTSGSASVPVATDINFKAELSGDTQLPSVPTLPKQSRVQRYQKALDINAQKAEQIRAEVENLAQSDQLTEDQYKQMIEEFTDAATKAEYFEKAIQGNEKLVEADSYNRFVDVGMRNLSAMLIGSVGAMSRLNALADPTSKLRLDAANEYLAEKAKNESDKAAYYGKILDDAAGYSGKEIQDIYKEKGLAGAIEYGAKKFTESAPVTAYIAGMSAVGLAPLANAQLFTGTSENRYNELKGRTDMSEEAKIANALGYGATELLFEGLLTTGVTSLAKQYIKQFGKEAAKQELKKTILGTIKQGLKKTTPLNEIVLEGLGEGATQLSQNLIDKYSDPTQKDIDPMQGVVNSAAIGAIGGSGFASTTVAGALVNKSGNKTKLEELEKQKADIANAMSQVSPQTAGVLQDDAAKIQQEQNEIILNDREVLTDVMSEEQRETVKNLSNTIDDLTADLQNVDEQAQPVIQGKIDQLQSQIDQIYEQTITDRLPSATEGSEPVGDNADGTENTVPEGAKPEPDQGNIRTNDPAATPTEGDQAGTGTTREPSQEPLVNSTQSNKFETDETETQQRRLNGLSLPAQRGGEAIGAGNAQKAVDLAGEKRADSQKAQEQALEEFSKENNLWIEDPDTEFGEEIDRGSEALVFSPDDTHVVKTAGDFFSGSPADFFDRIKEHNKFAESVPYEVVGFSRNKAGEFLYILKQPYIGSETNPTQSELDEHMKARGFTAMGRKVYENDYLRLSDVSTDNVLIDENGKYHFIDTRITRKKSGEDLATQEKGGTNNGKGQEKRREGNEGQDVLSEAAGDTKAPAVISEEDKVRTNDEAAKMGWQNAPAAINSINKRRGTSYKTWDEIPDDIKEQVSDERKKEKAEKEKDIPPGEGEAGAGLQDRPGKKLKLAKRILQSDEVSEDIKEGLKKEGTTYIPVSLKVTKEEAQAYTDAFDENDELDVAMDNVMDMSNGMAGLVRATIGSEVFKRYSEKAAVTESLEKRREYNAKAAKIAAFTAVQLKNAGQEINAGKIWKELLSKTPQGVISELDRQYKERNEPIIEKDIKDIRSAKRVLEDLLNSPEAQQIIETKVEREIERRGEQLFGREQKKKITDFFDGLLIDTKNQTFDATLGLPVAIWNGAIKTMKHAVLLGATTANAIKAGVDYIRNNHTGQWDEREFELLMKSRMKGLKVNRRIVPTEKQQKNVLDEWEKRLKRLKPENRKKLLANSIEELNREGALSEERFKELYAEAMGLETLTDNLKQKIFDLVGTINNADATGERYKRLFDKEGVSDKELSDARKEYEKAVVDARKANDSLSELFREKKNVWDTLMVIMQGNLLTPLSIATNIYSNTALQPLRFFTGGVASLADYIISQGAKHTALGRFVSKERSYDMITRTQGAWKGFIPGIKEGWQDLKAGLTSDEINQRDLQSKLDPLKSAADLWAAYHGKKNMATSDQVNAWAEVVAGVPAELMFRLLNLGDKPFRKMAELGKAYELANQKGLTGRSLEQFLEFPDEVSAEEIRKAGDESTFQQDNVLSSALQRFQKWVNNRKVGRWPIGRVMGFILKAIIPYSKTPSNIIGETLYYSFPELSFFMSLVHAKTNRKQSLKFFGIGVTGLMVRQIATQLLIEGLLTGSDEEDNKKKRSIRYENVPPNSLNISALRRKMAGGDWNIQDDDVWINTTKMGVFGSTLAVHADVYKDKIASEIEDEPYLDMVITDAMTVARSGIKASYLYGANTLIEALSEGGDKIQKLMVGIANTISSIPYPNTVASISRTSDDFIRETRDPDFWNQLENTFKNKMFMGDKLPSKITLWGEPVRNAPEGRNKWAYSLFDVTKFREVDTDNFGYKIFEQYNKTKDPDWLPSIPKNEVTIRKEKIKLTPQQHERLQMLVGAERKKLAQMYISSQNWDEATDEKRVKILKKLYDQGYEIGLKLLFQADNELYKLKTNRNN